MALIWSNNEPPETIICDPDFKQWADRYNWRVRVRKDGVTKYAARYDKNSRTWIGMHIDVWERKNRKPVPAGHSVDHENNDGLDNRYENLRLATPTENNVNRRVFKNSTTGKKGVTERADGKFVARITVKGKRVFLGAFETAALAAEAYDNAAKANFGEFANTNADNQQQDEE